MLFMIKKYYIGGEMKKVIKRMFVLILSLLMVIAILPQIKINAKAKSGVDDFVTRCYQVSFGRKPDEGGFKYWKSQITDGKLVGSTVVYKFIFSEEYEKQKRTDKEYVNDLYTMFMGRPADKEGYEFWCAQIEAGKSREDVFAGFANSKEFYELCVGYGITSGYYTNDFAFDKVNNVNLFVERLYKTCLGRIGDQGGQKYWVEGLLKGELTGIACAANYIKSSEYEDLGLSNEKYVENLYIAFMGRTYDEAGKANWLGHLNKKTMTRDQVFEGFANSAEFQGICANYGIECGSYKATDIADPNYKEPPVIKSKKYYYNSEIQWKRDYDTKGNIVKETYFDSYGVKDWWISYDYDSKGYLIKETGYNPDGTVFYWADYVNNSSGKVIKYTLYDEGVLDYYIEYQYDKKGRITWEIAYSNKGKVTNKNEYRYDSKGRLDTYVNYKDTSVYTSYEQYWYDENGDLTVKDYFEIDGLVYKYKMLYDTNHNMISKKTYNKDIEVIASEEFSYDTNNNLIKLIHYQKGGSVEYIEDYEYEYY